ncbi:ParB/RepB/Spo0J family partition protein (plasmid) [Robbsia andropogonis]|uniref:ParB/RepB/Spo0J family partition protein n=1 Tax=Robbsia andropogonis TaxID=28092 RepID=UPI003D243025
MNIRARMAQQTANLRSTSDIKEDEVRRPEKPKTGPGMTAALAASNLRLEEIEAHGVAAKVALELIEPNPWQPRKVFDEEKLGELERSISALGLLQPVVLRSKDSGYQLIAGERRFRAHERLKLATINALVVNCSDEDMAIFALSENVNRDDLSDFEIAQSIANAERQFKSRKKLAEALGMSRAALYRYLAFQSLPSFMLEDLGARPTLLGGHAAQEIVSRLKKISEAGASEETIAAAAWPRFVSGALDQAQYVATLVVSPSAVLARQRGVERSIDKFFAGKQHAGSITKDASNFILKIRSGVLSPEQETQIRDVVSAMFKDKPQ